MSMPPPPPCSLAELAVHLEETAHRGGWGGPPALVALTCNGQPVEPAPVPPAPAAEDLVAGLLGLVAPPSWQAVGVVVEGEARAFDPGTVAGYRHSASEAPHRCRVVHLVDRAGRAAGVVRVEGDRPRSMGDDEAPGEGRMVDACRRMLGLATAPPPETTHELWASMWLDELVADAADPTRSGPIASWEDAALRHPAADVVLEADESLRPHIVRDLAVLGRAIDAAKPWAHLRRECAAGRWCVPGLSPEAAAWMDDGMFARWTTSEFPPIRHLLGALEDLVPAGISRRIRLVLTSWGVLDHPA